MGIRDWCFFFQAEDGIRAAQESRGLGDVYKRQHKDIIKTEGMCVLIYTDLFPMPYGIGWLERIVILSLIHI